MSTDRAGGAVKGGLTAQSRWMTDDWFDWDLDEPGSLETSVQRGVLGAALFDARQCAGLSQRELAERADVTQAVVSRLERGPRQPSWQLFVRLLDAMDMEPSVAAHRNVASLDAEVERLRTLTPEKRWADGGIDDAVEALVRVFGQLAWALDSDAALLGHGVPVRPELLAVAFLEDDTTLAALFDAAVGARWIHVAENVRARLGEIATTTRANEMRELATEGWTVLGLPVSARLVDGLGGVVRLPFQDNWVAVMGIDRLLATGPEAKRALDRWAIRARLGA